MGVAVVELLLVTLAGDDESDGDDQNARRRTMEVQHPAMTTTAAGAVRLGLHMVGEWKVRGKGRGNTMYELVREDEDLPPPSARAGRHKTLARWRNYFIFSFFPMEEKVSGKANKGQTCSGRCICCTVSYTASLRCTSSPTTVLYNHSSS